MFHLQIQPHNLQEIQSCRSSDNKDSLTVYVPFTFEMSLLNLGDEAWENPTVKWITVL